MIPPRGQMMQQLHKMLGERIKDVVYMDEDIRRCKMKDVKTKLPKYFKTAASDYKVIDLDRKESCTLFVRGFMKAFESAYWEEPVFYIINLEPLLQEASKIVLSACKGKKNLDDKERNNLVKEQYIRCKREAATSLEIWSVCSKHFEEWDRLFIKVYKMISESRREALKNVLNGGGRCEEQDKVKSFISSWIQLSLANVWKRFQERDFNPITEEHATSLYCSLIAPWGCEDSVSGIPYEILPCGPTHYADHVACQIKQEFVKLPKKSSRSGLSGCPVVSLILFCSVTKEREASQVYLIWV